MLFLDDLVDATRPAIDVGGWWGPWTYWLSRRCPRVWVFEPNPRLAGVLARCVASHVVVEQVALSDGTGTTSLFAPDGIGPDALATVEVSHRHASSEEIPVRRERLDDYEVPDVGFLKIDVEGHERAMLVGAIATIERCRPVVLVEIEQRFHPDPIEDVFDILVSRGYSGWVRRDGRWAPIESFTVERDQVPFEATPKDTRYINNFVFTPVATPPGALRRGDSAPTETRER